MIKLDRRDMGKNFKDLEDRIEDYMFDAIDHEFGPSGDRVLEIICEAGFILVDAEAIFTVDNVVSPRMYGVTAGRGAKDYPTQIVAYKVEETD